MEKIIQEPVTHPRELVKNQATHNSRISAKIQNLRNQWQVEAKKILSFRTIIFKNEMTYPEFCELMIAFGSISMVRQGDNQRFEIDSKNKKIIMQLYKYITYNPDFEGNLDKGILLTGPFGTGKSVLMSAFASILTDYADSEIGQRRGVKVCKYIKSTEIFNEIIRNGRELPTKLVNTALVIDELGREAIKANDFGNDRHPIIDLIQARYNKGIVTHGTSNFSCHDLTSIEKYGPMIGDRIKSMFNFLELLGDSRRK